MSQISEEHEQQSGGGFTPGPWVMDEAGICGQDRLVAQVCRAEEFYAVDDDEVPEAEVATIIANARLIAAAPDLFEALEELLFEDHDKTELARMATRLKGRAAIARATGAS